MKNIFAFMQVLLVAFNFATAQQKIKNPDPQIGQPMVDHTFTDLVNYPAKSIKISDFKGKWLIIDAWDHGCSGCLASFPKMNNLDQKFKGKIQLLMLGLTEAHGKDYPPSIMRKTNHEAFTRLSKKHDLRFSVAYDSTFNDKYKIRWRPTIFIVDPKGILYAITNSVNEDQLTDLTQGKQVKFKIAFLSTDPFGKTIYNGKLPLLTSGKEANGGNDTTFLYRSLLKEYDRETEGSGRLLEFNNGGSNGIGLLEGSSLNLPMLYTAAYFGDHRQDHPNRLYSFVFRNPKKLSNYGSLFIDTNDSTLIDTEKYYSYSLKVPREKANPEFLMKVMRADLDKYFGLKVEKGIRKIPVLCLEIADSVKFNSMISKSEKFLGEFINGKYDGYRFRKISPAYFAMNLQVWLDKNSSLYPIKGLPLYPKIIDRTGKSQELDFDFKANMLDNNSIIAELSKHGFKLVKGYKEMECLIVNNAQ